MTNDPIAPASISRRSFLGTTLAALSAGIASKKGFAYAEQSLAPSRKPAGFPRWTNWRPGGWIAANWLICPPCITFMRWPPAHRTWWA